jgi:ribonuclease P/MRP protein subunit RPP40
MTSLNALLVDIDKCSVLGLHGRSNQSNNVYVINSCVLQGSNTVRDLGVLIDETLSYKQHITSIVNKAMQRVGVLFRGFVCRDLQFLRRAFITYIRPILECNSVIWSPTKKKYIDLIERVQRKFTKRIPCLQSMSYLERLNCINLQSLELRRLHFDLIYYYKIIHGLTPIDPEVFFTFHAPPVSLRRSTPFIQKPLNGSVLLLSTFAYRSVTCWNNLSDDVRSLSSLPAFKRTITNLDFNSFSCFSNLYNFNMSILS